MANVLLGCPRYKEGRDDLDEIHGNCSRRHSVNIWKKASALLSWNCNGLLRRALNERTTNGYTWFAMLHFDILPEPNWLDKLIDEAEKHGADFMSAVVPLKSASGNTSTALAQAPSPIGNRRRLTQGQVRHPEFPDTFDVGMAADAIDRLPEPFRIDRCPRFLLWCNTGCFVVRISNNWDWTRIYFSNQDGLQLVNGEYREYTFPEDWAFSQRVAEGGGKVMATRLINLIHYDEDSGTQYHSSQVWGNPVDLG
jgi:hypothetical protein